MFNKNLFKNKIVLVTGATGSIGKSLVQRILKTNCKTIRAMSNDEDGLFKLKSVIEINKNYIKKIRFLYGDIRDPERCELATKGVDIVIHAAAMKHVEICSYNPNEAIKTNILGTQNLIEASKKNKVKNFLFISTDKSALATTTMGQTKHLAEKLVLNAGMNAGKPPIKFSAIRFGNILASRGSVVEKFIYQIKANLPLTVTDKRMIRYFMTIENAVEMIISSIQISKGCEVFILKNMGKFKIMNLANALKKYFKYKKQIKFIKKNIGEKLNEEFISEHEVKYLKENKQMYILDIGNRHKNLKKINQIKMNEKLLNDKEIILLFKKQKILN